MTNTNMVFLAAKSDEVLAQTYKYYNERLAQLHALLQKAEERAERAMDVDPHSKIAVKWAKHYHDTRAKIFAVEEEYSSVLECLANA